MTSEIYNLQELNTTATVVTGLTGPPEVMLAYDGTMVPLTLFLNLGAVGFAGLTAQPPPADAIDWTTPDPLRGTSHTVRSYRAVSIGPFDGAPKDRERAVDAARLILERLASPTLPPPPDTSPSVAATNGAAVRPATNGAAVRPATASPVVPNGNGGRTIDAALAAVSAPGAVDQPTTSAPMAPPPPGATVLEIVVDAGRAAELRPVLAAHGDITEERPVTWTTEVRFRGSIEEKHHPAVRFTVSVDPAREESLMITLSAYRLRSLDVVTPRPRVGAPTS